jgi:RimJ/RimL family protein N-acetyltransferase
LSGHAFRLRPVDETDAEFIVDLRGRAGTFLHRGAKSTTEQLTWLACYFERPGDYYFVVETADQRRREGLVGLYDLDPQNCTAEWGRWVLEPGSNAAVESALLIYRCAFVELALEGVRCRTLVENERVVAFHDNCGLERGPSPIWIEHDGERRPAIVHTLLRHGWPHLMGRLDRLATRFARAGQTRSSAVAS